MNVSEQDLNNQIFQKNQALQKMKYDNDQLKQEVKNYATEMVNS